MAIWLRISVFIAVIPSFAWAEFSCIESYGNLRKSHAAGSVGVKVDFKPDATLVLVHPEIANPQGIEKWSKVSINVAGTHDLISPIESARSALLPLSPGRPYREVISKGLGLIPEHVRGNRLRDSERGFNGKLELSAACRDFAFNRVLESLGARVSKPLAVVDRNEIFDFGDFRERTAAFTKAFRNQTRVSNLAQMSPPERKAEIDEAITNLREDEGVEISSYADYFDFLVDRAAYNAALYQSAGFTQDSLHSGQMTIAGELTDFEIGSLTNQDQRASNVLHPWFRFERQPLVLFNMLLRTHSLKAEPHPVRLPENSNTLAIQNSMFGYIRSFDAGAAEEIAYSNPESRFWKAFDAYAKEFDQKQVRQKALEAISREFNFDKDFYLSNVSEDLRRVIQSNFETEIQKLIKTYEAQNGPWDKLGLPAQLQYSILQRVAAPYDVELTTFTPQASIRILRSKSHLSFTWRPQDLPKTVFDLIAEKSREFPNNIRLASSSVDGKRHDVLLISLKGLSDDDRKKVLEAYNSSFKDHLGFLISHQDPQPHTFLRWRAKALDYVFFDEFEGENAHLRNRDQRLARKLRLDVEVPLVNGEVARWERYLDGVLTKPISVLGNAPIIVPNSNEGVTVLSRATNSSIDDNRFLDGCSRHNCLTWASLAPIGNNGEQLVDLLGFTPTDIQAEAHSYTVAFAQKMLRGHKRSRESVFVLQADEDLDSLEQKLGDPNFLPSLIRKEPDPD